MSNTVNFGVDTPLSAIYRESPLVSEASTPPNSQKSSPNASTIGVTLTMPSLVIAHVYENPIERLEQILTALCIFHKTLPKKDVWRQVVDIMEHVEEKFSTCSAAQKKSIVTDTVFFLGDKCGLSPMDIDSQLISSAIDIIAEIGKNGTTVNQRSNKQDHSTQTNVSTSSWCACFDTSET